MNLMTASPMIQLLFCLCGLTNFETWSCDVSKKELLAIPSITLLLCSVAAEEMKYSISVSKQPSQTVWAPWCHHLRLRWSDKWDFNWVFRLSNIRRWDRIIQEHINKIKSSQIWQLYCIRNLPALPCLLPLPPMLFPSRACCFEKC